MKNLTRFTAIFLCFVMLLLAVACDTDDQKPNCEHEKDDGAAFSITEWGKDMEYTCKKCNEKIKESVNGKLTLENAPAKEGYTFVGWQIGDTVYSAGQTVPVYGGETVTPIYDNTGAHTCAYTKADGSVEPTCTVIGKYSLTCSCGKAPTEKTMPALGHAWTEWSEANAEGYSERKCETCSLAESKKLLSGYEGKKLLAFGDSITYGKKVGGNDGSYAKFVAEALGCEYENRAISGSEAYQWYSLLSEKPAPNNKYTTKIDGKDDAPSIDHDQLVAYVSDADIIIFTLGTNDIFYTQYRKPDQIRLALTNLVYEINKLNPEAKIIVVGGAYFPSFWDGATYEKDQDRLYELAGLLTEHFSKDKYNDFTFFVDITTILSDINSYTDVSYGNPDNIHPGYKANEKIAQLVLDSIKK